LSIDYDDYLEQKNLRAKINDMLARIASLEDKVRELQFLLDVKE
jgi:DNA-directed RNA polymerase sigma subunit (sigma70/sigma32)